MLAGMDDGWVGIRKWVLGGVDDGLGGDGEVLIGWVMEMMVGG